MRNGISTLDKPNTNREGNGADDAGASDIHLHMRGQTAEVCFRLDGVITPASAW